eukprot:scaffold22874_cov59-Cyclotella_meneghiniana.AAC.1
MGPLPLWMGMVGPAIAIDFNTKNLYCQQKKYARVCQRVQVENNVPFSGHQKDHLTYTCRQESERSLVFATDFTFYHVVIMVA